MKICGGWSTSSEAGMASGRRQQADMRVAMVIHENRKYDWCGYKTGRKRGSAGAVAENRGAGNAELGKYGTGG